MTRASILAAACFVFVAGCGDDAKVPATPPAGPAVDPQGSVAPLDHPPFDAPAKHVSAGSRRLTVSQLSRSLAIALGKDASGADITWKIGQADGFTVTAGALGEPDYIQSTERALEPGLLYAKFVDDAARSGCDQALVADDARANKADRVLLRHVEWNETADSARPALEANMRYLKLRMHGIKLADDPAAARPLVDLFDRASKGAAAPDAKGKAVAGWRAVCVALITAPEFQLY
jgi:hypothetical protein